MKPSIISILTFASLASISQLTLAAGGMISFAGSVTGQTCTINGNGSGSKDFTVSLPTVLTTQLAAAGNTAGQMPFSIDLTDCMPSAGKVHAFFEPGPTVSLASGRLMVSGGAGNVEIGLLNSDRSVIRIGAQEAAQNAKPVAIDAKGRANLPFYAQYVATGRATSGTANSSVLYTLVYQ
ncbi:fimbrial protein [Comamonas composti]|uniref:fimbrial protein n=1 Tax=Comamonas composti TaxID=408558 RepID=UPI000413B9FB|nr:fimbrial protein [Comamonas composti]